MKLNLAIIGGGPSALLLAANLDPSLFQVTIYEQQKTVGRKFLVAGKGGFNLTYDSLLSEFISQYSPSQLLADSLTAFNPSDLRQWLSRIAIKTYTGSSGRVFPTKEIKPIDVLKAILQHLEEKGVKIKYEHQWTGWDDKGSLTFANGLNVNAAHTIFALGGGSWKITGSDGHWLPILKKNNIKVNPFKGVNCGFSVDWEKTFLNQYEGQPIKNIRVSHGSITRSGELKITDYGLEGNAIYGVSNSLQSELEKKGKVELSVDLKPMLSEDEIKKSLSSSSENISQRLSKEIKVSKVKIALLKSILSKEEYLDVDLLSSRIKALPITVSAPRSLDEAISTIGGIHPNALTSNFELKEKSQHYCIGEMVDWFAPTGGYLLQGCFSMGVSLARHLNSLNQGR